MLPLIPLALTLVALAGYGAALIRLRRRGDRSPPAGPLAWSQARCAWPLLSCRRSAVTTKSFPSTLASTCCWA